MTAWTGALRVAMVASMVASGITGVGESAQVGGDLAKGSSVRDSRQAPTEAQALSIARTFRHAVEVEELLTDTETVSALPDGSFHYTSSSLPVRVQQDSGDWQAVDLTLTQSDDGWWVPSQTPTPVRFAPGGSAQLVSMQAQADVWTTQSWGLGTLPPAQVSGVQATYPEVLPGVDLVLTATVAGYSEVVVVKTAEAAANPLLDTIKLALSSNHPLTGVPATGGMDLRQGAAPETTVAHVGKAAWWDSSFAGSGTTGPGGPDVERSADASYSTHAIKVDTDPITDQPGLVYPIYIDPSYSWSAGINGGSAYTYVDAYYPNDSFWNGGHPDHLQHVGYADDGSGSGAPDKARAYWRMDTLGIGGKHILTAEFNTFEVWSYSCTARQVDLYESSGGISSSTTWNNKPIPGTLQGSATVAYGYSSSGINGPSSCSTGGHAVGFNAMPAVIAAAAGNKLTTTLLLAAHDEADSLGWKKFRAAATLDVTYNSVPNVPGNRGTNPSSACVTGSGRPVLNASPIVSATATDVDGGTVRVNFEWWPVGGSSPRGSALTSLQASGTVFAAQVPIGTFANGEPGSWRARTYDGTDYSGWSTWCEFVLDTTAPAAPKVKSTDFPEVGSGIAPTKNQGDTGTFTFRAAGSDDVTRYVYNLNGRPSQQCTPAQVGGSCTVTVGPGLTLNQMAVTSYDAANNPSGLSIYSFKLMPTTTTRARWTNMGLGVNNGWKSDTNPRYWLQPAVGAGGDPNSPPVGDSDGVHFDGQYDYAFSKPVSQTVTDQSLVPLLDTAESFTVAAKIEVNTPSRGSYQTFMAAGGQTDSLFYLQFDPTGHIRFALTGSDTAQHAAYIASTSSAEVKDTCGWSDFDPTIFHTYIGVYDKEDAQARLYVDGCPDPVARVDLPGPLWTATGTLLLGTALQAGLPAHTNEFGGSVLNVWLIRGAMTPDALVDGFSVQ